MIASLSARELGHVLAGLRLLQAARHHSVDIEDIITNGGAHEPMAPGEIDDLCERLNLASAGAAAGTDRSLPKEVAERLHRWGNRDALFTDVEDAFLNAYDQDGFVFGEQFFYDPETRKTYRTQLTLEIDLSDPPDEDTCARCGEGLADATDIPDDVICDVCGWSRSGVRRCIRCGTRDPEQLVPDDAVCKRCRSAT